MKTFRLLTFLLVMMGCSFVANARPAIFHLFINGDTIEYAVMPAPNYKPLINLPAKDNAKYLSGIVMASPSEIATAKVQFTEWLSTLNYVIVLMDLHTSLQSLGHLRKHLLFFLEIHQERRSCRRNRHFRFEPPTSALYWLRGQFLSPVPRFYPDALCG